MNKPSKILFQLSGSIACFKACALLSKLSQAGYEIEVVASRSALQFVGEATLEGLTGKRVHTDTFEAGRAMDHIHLMRWADVIVLCPASANTLNKFASGFGDDLLSTMFLAHDFKKPYLIAPAMNQFMWSHPATKASVEKLQSWGLEILGTGKGNLACGEVGEGRMLEPEQIQMAIELALGLALALPQTQKTSGRHILITSGGTEEPIDGVRSITNTSTGRTGADLAHWFADHGDQVTLLHAKSAVVPNANPNLSLKSFTSFASLENELKTALKETSFDAIIHLAAVADYSLGSVESNGATYQAPLKEKIDSGEELVLKLKKNPKLVDSIRSYSKNPEVKLIAFKLTATDQTQLREQAVRALASHAKADFVVHNDATEISSQSHLFTIYDSKGTAVLSRANGANRLAPALATVLDQRIGGHL